MSLPQPPELSRRALAGLCLAGAFLPASAFAPSPDFVIDWQGGPETPAVAASLAAQIALVRKLRIKPDIAAFFAGQPITVDLADDTHTRAGPRGVFFERRAVPADNPVLLHELLHRYHLLRLPNGFRNPTILDFYNAAKAGGKFPAEAYMLKNVQEFFAMTTSVVLHGRAARPPFVRANVAEKLPELYRWVIGEFGLIV